jgi:phage virion morphogenesis protein
MPGEPFSIQIDDQAVRTALAQLSAKCQAPKAAMEDIGRALRNITEDSFQDEASPWGAPWKALNEHYVERARQRGGRGGDAHPILQRDGGMAGSLFYTASATSAEIGVAKGYAARHQFGGTPEYPMPKRSFLPVERDGTPAPVARQAILDCLTRYLAST